MRSGAPRTHKRGFSLLLTVKNHSNDRIPLSGYPYFLHVNTRKADPGYFARKNPAIFAIRNPLYFRPAMRFVRSAGGRGGQSILPFFAPAGRPLKAPVAFCLKCPVSQNPRFKQKSWSGLAPFPLELFSYNPTREALRRRNDPG